MKSDSSGEFKVPPGHIGFLAKNLLAKNEGSPANVSIAYIEPNGGGPEPAHTHAHDHIFFVISGEAKIQLMDEWVIVKENEAIHVPGKVVHSVWNNENQELKMLGINI